MLKIGIIGNGNWATAMLKLVALNVQKSDLFDSQVLFYIHEEVFNGEKLSEYINVNKENPKYLPGIKLPKNFLGVTDISNLNEADVLIFCLPHQFIDVVRGITPKKGAFAINLCKGVYLEEKQMIFPSQKLEDILKIPCCCLMGANIANEVAEEKLSECTVGYTDQTQIPILESLFKNHFFRPKIIPYDKGIEICGGLKNVISFAYGLVQGLQYGSNTESILFRKGLIEIEKFCNVIGAKFLPLESCCIGDLLTSCLSGRNYKCGYMIAKNNCKQKDVEDSMCGQKLQGSSVAKSLVEWMIANNISPLSFPIFNTVYRVIYCDEHPSSIYTALAADEE